VHRASWPAADEVVAPIGGEDRDALRVFQESQLAIGELRRLKALAKKPVKAVIAKAVFPQKFAAFMPAARDLQAAGHLRELSFADVTDLELTFAEEPLPEPRA
jgi:hypothetical protein